ncbi:MAG: tetrahydrofolate dehydrogenase/cyclohydrolase catalytic domain-containing protein, partial [Patescibacteria group bacterium]
MSQIIDGRILADKIKDKIVQEVVKLIALPGKEAGELKRRPNLAIILVGERPDSAIYVAHKEKEATKCGIDTHIYKFPADASEQELLTCVDYLNRDDLIDGILLQLPLPPQFNADKIIAAISADKEVDGFHPDNLKKIHAGEPYRLPVLAAVILEILTEIKCDLR